MKLQVGIVLIIVAVLLAGTVVYGAYRFSPTRVAPAPEPTVSPAAEQEQAAVTNAPGPSSPPAATPPAGTDAAAGPMIRVEPAVLDMGVVPREGPAVGEFKILNKGRAPLVISQVTATCGCTVPSIDPSKKNIPPGGETPVSVTVNLKQIHGFEAQKTVTVASNDPQYPKMNIQVKLKIDPEFAVEPGSVNFGDVPKGTPAEKTIVFRQLTQEPIEVLEVRSLLKTPGMNLSFVKRPQNEWASSDKPEYLITIRLTEDAPPGLFNGHFNIQNTCKRLPSFACAVQANVTAFYNFNPKQLIVRPGMAAGQPGTTSCLITADRPFEVLDLKTSKGDLTVSSKPGAAPNSVNVEVALKPEAQSGQDTLSFTIKSGDQVFKEQISIQVFASRPSSIIRPMKTGGKPATPAPPFVPGQRVMPPPPPAPPTPPPTPAPPPTG